jgi:GINS complex subunit 1
MSSQHGQRARALVTELRLSRSSRGALDLPRYNNEGLRGVLAETNEHFEKLKHLMGDKKLDELPKEVKATCHVHNATIKRNKRCALTYLDQRASTIKALRWELGPIQPEAISSKMSLEEKNFINAYGKLLIDYGETVGIDLTSDLVPPKDLKVQVRVLRECGEICLESGTVDLQKGTVHFLKRREIEQLVRVGDVEIRNDHESC